MWGVIRIFDGKWSVRFDGRERWVLPGLTNHQAMAIERMMNQLELLPYLYPGSDQIERREVLPWLPL